MHFALLLHKKMLNYEPRYLLI